MLKGKKFDAFALGLQAQISTICLTAKTTKFRFIKEPIFNTTAYRCVVVSL